MRKKLLCVDIGNTNVTFGFSAGAQVTGVFDLTHDQCTLSRLRAMIGKSRVSAAIVSSVVPRLTPGICAGLKKLTGAPVFVLGKDIKVPLANKYRYPRQVGQDRLVNAYAVARLYGTPAICVDYGTATTFDLVSRRKEYLGGLIMPGLSLSLKALARNTALLPQVELAPPQGLIGRETRQSMLSGVVFGAALMTETLVKRLKKKLGAGSKVVLTGGNARLIHRYCPGTGRVDAHLTLKGLALVFAAYHRLHHRL